MNAHQTLQALCRSARLSAVIAFFVLTACLPAASQAARTAIHFTGGTLTASPNWHLTQSDQGSFLLMGPSSAGIGANINLIIRLAPPGFALAKVQTQLTAIYQRSFNKFKIVSVKRGLLGGIPSFDAFVEAEQGKIQVYVKQSFALYHQKVYVFTCTSLAATHTQSDPLFAQMLGSVRWSK